MFNRLKPQPFASVLFLLIFCGISFSADFDEERILSSGKILCTCEDTHRVLSSVALPVEDPTHPKVLNLIQEMKNILIAHGGGAGLAAPQIGVSKQVVICSFDRTPENLQGMINPSYLPAGEETVESWEGCFSVPLTFVKIARFKTIDATYLTAEGETIAQTLTGFPAKVFQHECDHLKGCLITNHEGDKKVCQDKEEFDGFLAAIRSADSGTYVRSGS